MNISIETMLLSCLALVACSGVCAGQLPEGSSVNADQGGVTIRLDDGLTADAEIIQLDDAPTYSLNDENAEQSPSAIGIHQLPREYHFSDQTHFVENGQAVNQSEQNFSDSHGMHFWIEKHDDFQSENYLHLMYPPVDPNASEMVRNVATPESSYERALSHIRAGNPKSISKRASLTYGDRYGAYYVGGGVLAGRPNKFGESRASHEGTLGVDYAPRYSRVASNWSHGRLYQGGVGQYEPDHKNRPLGGQTLGRFFSKRERRHAEADHESHHHHHSAEEPLEPLFESEVTDADSAKRN